jgi:hypothetical protein
VTAYRVLSVKDGNSLLEVELITGRTHQIRAHMAHIGHPLLGDGKYGVNRTDRSQGYKYQALYAYRLIFDFENDSGTLGYLRGKEIRLPDEEVWFLADFAGGTRWSKPVTTAATEGREYSRVSHQKAYRTTDTKKTRRADGKSNRTAASKQKKGTAKFPNHR